MWLKNLIKILGHWGSLFFVILIFILLVTSIYILHQANSSDRSHYTPDELIRYASGYLPGNEMSLYGRRLDCSGYTRSVFRHFHSRIPRSSTKQSQMGKRLSIGDLEKGDLVFFAIFGHDVSHVGIYMGENRFIHSPGKNQDVRIDSIDGPYWRKHFKWGIRIIRE